MNRLFTFGCSFTSYIYPTWADFLGENFDEYYNCGIGGASNDNIFGRFIEANTLFNFSENDYVVVMLTSVDRFSFFSDNKWKRVMDYDNDHDLFKIYLNEIYSSSWGLYRTYTYINAIKNILELKKIPHKILNAFKLNESMVSEQKKFYNFELSINFLKYMKKFESLSDFIDKKYEGNKEYYLYSDWDHIDFHPTVDMHFSFFKEHFPNYVTDNTEKLYSISKNYMAEKRKQKEIMNFFETNIFVKRKPNFLTFF